MITTSNETNALTLKNVSVLIHKENKLSGFKVTSPFPKCPNFGAEWSELYRQ